MNDPTLIENYVTYYEIRSRVNDIGIQDLRPYSWFYPTTLLPVFHLKKTKSLNCDLHPKVKYYFDIMEQGNLAKERHTFPSLNYHMTDPKEKILSNMYMIC